MLDTVRQNLRKMLDNQERICKLYIITFPTVALAGEHLSPCIEIAISHKLRLVLLSLDHSGTVLRPQFQRWFKRFKIFDYSKWTSDREQDVNVHYQFP